MIEHHITVFITSADLRELATKAEQIEKSAKLGENLKISDWYCGDHVRVHFTVDQQRAKTKGLMTP